jgi:hypothetical protein
MGEWTPEECSPDIEQSLWQGPPESIIIRHKRPPNPPISLSASTFARTTTIVFARAWDDQISSYRASTTACLAISMHFCATLKATTGVQLEPNLKLYDSA